MKKKIWKLIVLLVVGSMLFAACSPRPGAPAASAPAPEAPPAEPENPEADLNEYLELATIEWLQNLQNPDQSLGILVGQVNNPVALIYIASVVTYSVVSQPELVADTAEIIVEGIEGVEAWVQDNFSLTMPAYFKPEGGELKVRLPGIAFWATWEATDSGCSYKGELNGQPLEELKVTDPCNPEDLLSMLYAQLDKFVKLLGDHRARSFLNTLHELISPFMQ